MDAKAVDQQSRQGGMGGALKRERARWYAADGHVRQIHWLRFSVVVFALLNVAAHLFALPAATPKATFWLEGEVAVYLLVAVIYLFGLRMWYLPALAYTVLNLLLFFVSGFVAIPAITTAALTGHLAVTSYSFGRGLSVLAWAYLLVVGLFLLRNDQGSKINELLRDS